MADETLPVDDDIETNAGPTRQKSWLQKNFVRNKGASKIPSNLNTTNYILFRIKRSLD